MPIDRRAERLLAMLAAGRGGAGALEPPEARRAALRSLAAVADEASTVARCVDAVLPGPAGPVPVRAYAPHDAGCALLPGLVFFSGGGWVAGDLETHDGFCRRLCAASGWRVVAVDYRRAPEHRFPAALDDCLAATLAIAADAAAFRIDPARLGVGGDSVGAGLAAAVAQASRGRGPALALQLLVCPILDVGRTGGSRAAFGESHFITRAAFERDLVDYAPDTGSRDPRLSPLHSANLVGLPPAIVHTAEFDPFRDEGEAYAARLAAAGVPATTHRHAGMIHYFYALARAIPYAREAAAMMGAQMAEVRNLPLSPAKAGAHALSESLPA